MAAQLKLIMGEASDDRPAGDTQYTQLYDRYHALVGERDRLLDENERLSTQETVTITCDNPVCASTFVLIAPAPAEMQLLQLSTSAGWLWMKGAHRCPRCRDRRWELPL